MRQRALPTIVSLAAAAAPAAAAPRDVQVRSINLATDVIELFNCGATDQSLLNWRTCSHDEDQIRRYSGNFPDITVEAGTSFFIHFANDAPIADPDRINRLDLGGTWATPLDVTGAYALGFYFPDGDGVVNLADFANGSLIADHLQWSLGGADDTTADDRSDEAQTGGVWTDQSQWINASGTTTFIQLTDTTCAILHGPADYDALDNPPPGCAGDVNGDDATDAADLSVVIGNFGMAVAPGTNGDINGDGMVDAADLSVLIGDFGCG